MDPHRNQHQLRRRKLHILRFGLRPKLTHFAASPLPFEAKDASNGSLFLCGLRVTRFRLWRKLIHAVASPLPFKAEDALNGALLHLTPRVRGTILTGSLLLTALPIPGKW